MKKIILIDGNSLMFRAYYATAYTGNLMQNRQGIYTNAIFGFVNMMNNVYQEEFDNIFVAFDDGSNTFRHQEYEEYKAGRKKFPEELAMQVPYIKRYLDILKIQRSQMADYEADDLIATVATKAYNEFDQIKIITGDKDLLQLVNDKVTVLLTRRGITDLDEYNFENFESKLNIKPNQVTDYKGLVGDSSDNLPGIKGIGEKTAIKLLSEYNDLEEIKDNLDKIKGRTKTLIEENYEVGLKCRNLARLHTNIDLEFSITDTIKEDYDIEELMSFYQELDFSTFLKRLDRKHNEVNLDDFDFKIIQDPSADLTKELSIDSYVTIEVVGKNYFDGTFLGLGIFNKKTRVFLTSEVVLKNPSVRDFLANNSVKKKTFDYKKLYVVLKKHNLTVNNVDFDLMLAAYLINPSFASDDFKNVINNFIDSNIVFEDNIYGSKSKINIPDIKEYAKYALDKAKIIYELEDEILVKLHKNNLYDLFANCEMPLVKVLGDMELVGLKIDQNILKEIGQELNKSLEIITQEIYDLAGEEFNINSVKQLGEVLFEKLGLPHGKKNKTGYSTNVEVLEKLASEYLIAQKVLDYRSLNKLITTYVNGLFEVIYDDGFIHPLYKQALTMTGRLSSVEPNIQNMPIRTEIGQTIRQAFISRFDDGLILSADYSQIELRVLAHLSGEEDMINSFNEGFDFHSKTASELFDVEMSNVTSDMRRTAKAINFGIIYGMSAWGLSENLKISPQEANTYISKYFDKYKKVKEYLDGLIIKALKDGYTQTILLRRRYIPELESKNANIRSFGERTAMNAPIQGSAADIIKLAMIKIDEEFSKQQLQSLLIAQVHDELVLDVKACELDKVNQIVKDVMENVIELKVKLNVDTNYGKNWFLAK